MAAFVLHAIPQVYIQGGAGEYGAAALFPRYISFAYLACYPHTALALSPRPDIPKEEHPKALYHGSTTPHVCNMNLSKLYF